MVTQAEKGRAFESLHERRKAFLIPNPWDIGTARMLAHVGFEALATTSMGFALSMGKQDNAVGREAVLEHAKSLTSAVDLPVSADLENGFGDTPEMCAQTIRLAAGAGLVGGSIEDFTGRSDTQIYELKHAADRIRARNGRNRRVTPCPACGMRRPVSSCTSRAQACCQVSPQST